MKVLKEDLDQLRIKVRSRFLLDDLQGFYWRYRFFVAAFACQRVVDVRYRHDTRTKRYILTLESCGISVAVPSFVMICRDIRRESQIALVGDARKDPVDDGASGTRVLLDLLEFLRRQFIRFFLRMVSETTIFPTS